MNGGLNDFLTFFLLQRLERLTPLMMVGLMDKSRQGRQRLLAISNNSHIGLHILVNLTMVDIKMNDLGLLGVGLRIARYSVREAHADGNEHIALLLLDIGRIVTVHTKHTHVQRMCAGQSRETKHGTSGRDVSFLQEGLQFLLRITQVNALPYQGQRLLGIVNQLSGPTYSLSIKFRIRNVATDEVHRLRLPIHFFDLRILRKVKHDRAWTSSPGYIESTADSPRNILGTTYLV